MAREPKKIKGTTVLPDEPNWEPLRRAASEWLLGQFMAMFEVDLKIGKRVCCYKHVDTRRSLHVDEELNVFVYCFDERRPEREGHYERVSLDEAFALVLLQPEFVDGWIERGRFDRPSRVDELGEEIYDEDEDEDEPYYVSRFEERMAIERWGRLRERWKQLAA
jgi:hypothetical protein